MKTKKGVMDFISEVPPEYDRWSKEAELDDFLKVAFSKPADPQKILCAYCLCPFVEGSLGAPCECPEGKKTMQGFASFAEKHQERRDNKAHEKAWVAQ